jgi:hypothetical protein
MLIQKIELCYFFSDCDNQNGWVNDHYANYFVFLCIRFLKIISSVGMYFKILLYLQT